MLVEIILKQLSILLISAVKFIVAAPASYMLGYSYLHTIMNTTFGGWMGVIFFYFLGKAIFRYYPCWKKAVIHGFMRLKGYSAQKRIHHFSLRKPAKIFTFRNRSIVKLRNKFGFAGLVILTPVIFSIPIGTVLITKYYSSRKGLVGWLSLSVMAWSVVISTFIKVI